MSWGDVDEKTGEYGELNLILAFDDFSSLRGVVGKRVA